MAEPLSIPVAEEFLKLSRLPTHPCERRLITRLFFAIANFRVRSLQAAGARVCFFLLAESPGDYVPTFPPCCSSRIRRPFGPSTPNRFQPFFDRTNHWGSFLRLPRESPFPFPDEGLQYRPPPRALRYSWSRTGFLFFFEASLR